MILGWIGLADVRRVAHFPGDFPGNRLAHLDRFHYTFFPSIFSNSLWQFIPLTLRCVCFRAFRQLFFWSFYVSWGVMSVFVVSLFCALLASPLRLCRLCVCGVASPSLDVAGPENFFRAWFELPFLGPFFFPPPNLKLPDGLCS